MSFADAEPPPKRRRFFDEPEEEEEALDADAGLPEPVVVFDTGVSIVEVEVGNAARRPVKAASTAPLSRQQRGNGESRRRKEPFDTGTLESIIGEKLDAETVSKLREAAGGDMQRGLDFVLVGLIDMVANDSSDQYVF